MPRARPHAKVCAMARFLFAAMPADGHLSPLLPVVRELRNHGHDAAVISGDRYRDRIEAAGAVFLPMLEAREIDAGNLDAQFPGRAETKGLGRFKFDMREIFIAGVPGQLADLEHHADAFAPDVVVVEPAWGGAANILHQRRGTPWVTVGISVLMLPSRDTPPFGLGLQPARGALGRARDKALYALIDR